MIDSNLVLMFASGTLLILNIEVFSSVYQNPNNKPIKAVHGNQTTNKISQRPHAEIMPDIEPSRSHSILKGFEAQKSVPEFTVDESSLKFGLMTLNRPPRLYKSKSHSKLSKNAKLNRIKSHESPLRTIQNSMVSILPLIMLS